MNIPGGHWLAEVLAAITLHGLPGVDQVEVTVTDDEWASLAPHLVTNRLTGLAAVAADAGSLHLSEEAQHDLAALDGVWAGFTLRAEDLLVETVQSFTDADIETLVLKGPAYAELVWSVPEGRRWVDADLLVHSRDLSPAVGLLERTGAQRRLAEVAPGFDQRYLKGVTMRTARGEVDVHRTIASPPFSLLLDERTLWDGRRSFEIEDVQLETMSGDACFVHACIHASVGGKLRLVQLRDVLETWRHASPAAAELVRQSRLRAVVDETAARVRRHLLLEDHAFLAWADEVSAGYSSGERSVVEAWNRFDERALALASVRLIPRWRDKLHFVASRLRPAVLWRRRPSSGVDGTQG